MKSKLRKKAQLKRKNFFPTLIATFCLWILVIMLVYFIDPQTTGALILFFLLVFLALFFTLAIIFENTRRGLIISLGTITFLALRYLGVGNVINFTLIFGIGLSSDIYFSKRNY
jgi:hypothetical protein